MNPTNQRRREQKPFRQGPIYDRSLRTTAEDDPDAFCAWLGESAKAQVKVISSSFTAGTLYADFVGQVGPDRVVHAEYMLYPDREAAVKMVAYRGQLMRSHPGCSIKQYAVVLAAGRLPSVDDPRSGFALGLHTIYLRDCDPAEILAYPSLGGLAVLARGDAESRVHALVKAMQGIQVLSADRQKRLKDAMAVLARIHLEPSTINRITKEGKMTIESVVDFYRQTEFGQELVREGHEQGREQGLVGALTALLQSRFGDHAQIPAIAQHLAQNSDDSTSVRIITEATSLDDLAARLMPAQST